MTRLRCAVCTRPVERMSVPIGGEKSKRMTLEPYRCKRCGDPLCTPFERDCWSEHWNNRHAARKVTDVETEKV